MHMRILHFACQLQPRHAIVNERSTFTFITSHISTVKHDFTVQFHNVQSFVESDGNDHRYA